MSSNKNKTPYDSRLIKNLADLDQNLKSAMRIDESHNKAASSPVDEFYYWQEKSKQIIGASSSANSNGRERADAYNKLFLPLLKHYENIQTASLLELVDLIEYTQDVYDDVWKQVDYDTVYPQDRMTNLLEITGAIKIEILSGYHTKLFKILYYSVGMVFLKVIQKKHTNLKPFEDPFIDVKEVLKNSITVCERWSDCCKILTKNFWKAFAPHKWNGDEFQPITVMKFCQRLREVYEIRSANEQYDNLVGGLEKTEKLDQKSMFGAFVGIDTLQYNPFTESVWRTAVAQYNREMLTYDQKISQILKNHLAKSQSNAQQVNFQKKINHCLNLNRLCI